MTSKATAPIASTTVPPQISYAVLTTAAAGFFLWALGWFILIPDHQAHVGWILEFVGPLLIAIAIVMFVEGLRTRVGLAPVILATIAALSGGVATFFFAINPANLETSNGVRFGYGGTAGALLIGSLTLMLVHRRKESHLKAQLDHTYPLCPAGCHCAPVIHASFGVVSLVASGLLIWGIGFAGHVVQPEGTRFAWVLAVIGSALVTAGLGAHFQHLGKRFGRAAIVIGIASGAIWSVGYLLEAIDPSAGPLSSWYTYLFLCYGVGHLLTALTLVMVARRKFTLER